MSALKKTRKVKRDMFSMMAARVRRLKDSGKEVAVATLNDPKVKGCVIFVQVGVSVHVEALIWDLPPGKHGIHIHEFGNMLEGCASLGAHWNPTGHDHGGPHDNAKHMGDFGNIQKGKTLKLVLRGARILDGNNSKFRLVGRSVVIHEGEDDLGRGNKPDSKTTGGSGARIGCGVIGLT
jgi:Cu-Zn family superoxide dismutase